MLLQEAGSTEFFFSLVPLVVFFPVIGLLINAIFGNRLSEKAVGTIASTASGMSFLVAVLQLIALLSRPEGETIYLADWITAGDLSVPWAFRVDTLSVTMMLVVTGVGTLIHIYAIGYMHEDVRINDDPARYPRFFVFFNLFIAAMMVLVSANNYLMLFVGWEGVGLCSYLLIGFWFDKGEGGIANAIAAKKAFVVNRIGDFGFLIAAFLMFWAFRSFEFSEVFPQVEAVADQAPGVILAITLFMLLGVTGKSAQLPLYVWLPDAMAGPTPVSALIHAATMVTAGVYLVARSYPLYVITPDAQLWVALVGGVTALFAATIALGQFDIKKVLAYSTVSQLGFMVAAVGMGAFVAGMFHLVTHAFFKALLFLSSGSVIQGVEHGHHHVEHDRHLQKQYSQHQYTHPFDAQDMRNMGGLYRGMKTTFWVYLIGALALAGIPPLAGFWSKDEILAEASILNQLVFWLLLFAAFLTAFYMARQIILVFLGRPRTAPAEHAVESPPLMTIPLIILAILSTIGGFLNLPNLHTFSDWLGHTIQVVHEVDIEEGLTPPPETVLGEFNPVVALAATGLAVAGIALGIYLYQIIYRRLQEVPPARRTDDPLRRYIGPVFEGMKNKWWVDELYDLMIIRPYNAISKFLADKVDWDFWHDWFHDRIIAGGFQAFTQFLANPVDLGIIDGFANAIGAVTKRTAAGLRLIQTGLVRFYALTIFLGVVLIVGYLIFR